MTFRADYRSAARAALAAVPRFAGMEVIRSWAGMIDDAALPVLGVVTASETLQPGSSGQFEHATLLQVVTKRRGGETIEDELDLDADAIVAAVQPALFTREAQCFPSDITFAINGDGRQRTGTVVVTFRITSWRPAP